LQPAHSVIRRLARALSFNFTHSKHKKNKIHLKRIRAQPFSLKSTGKKNKASEVGCALEVAMAKYR